MESGELNSGIAPQGERGSSFEDLILPDPNPAVTLAGPVDLSLDLTETAAPPQGLIPATPTPLALVAEPDSSIEINPCKPLSLDGETEPLLVSKESRNNGEIQEIVHDVRRQMVEEGIDAAEVDAQLLRDRNEEIQRIESDVVVVAETMTLLNQQVNQQGESLDRIDYLLSDAADETDDALLSWERVGKRANHRGRILKAIGIGIAAAAAMGVAVLASGVLKRDPAPLGNNNGNDNNKPPQ